MKKLLTFLLMAVMVISCSRKFKKDYEVIDASEVKIPVWLENPTEWAQKEDKDDFKKHRYYVVNIDPRQSREISCKIASANARNEVAAEVTAFIKSSFGQSTQGDPTASDEKLNEYIESTLAQEVQAFVIGASVHKTYWEKRVFKKELGAQKNWEGYTCSSLVKISKDNLKKAFKRAEEKLTNTAKPEVKENVKTAIKAAEEKYLSM